jgi:hypothetical protein
MYLMSLCQLHNLDSNKLQEKASLCEISGSHSGEFEDYSLLGYSTV